MTRSRVEEIARRIIDDLGLPAGHRNDGAMIATVVVKIARWHLRELRRARGRTVGYCVDPRADYPMNNGFSKRQVTKRRHRQDNCRVVIEPKRRKPR
jgi:hypothetical protein